MIVRHRVGRLGASAIGSTLVGSVEPTASAAVDDRPTPAASTAPPPGAITGAAARRSWTSKCVPRDGTTWTNSRREAAKPRPWTRSRYVPAGMPRSWKRPTLSVSMMRRSRPCAVTAAPDTGWLRSSVTMPFDPAGREAGRDHHRRLAGAAGAGRQRVSSGGGCPAAGGRGTRARDRPRRPSAGRSAGVRALGSLLYRTVPVFRFVTRPARCATPHRPGPFRRPRAP